MWFIAVEVEQETSAPPPKKNSGSASSKVPLFSLGTDLHKCSGVNSLKNER